MRAIAALLLLAMPLAGCLEDDATTQAMDEQHVWMVAQAEAEVGDVAGFVWTLPETVCLPDNASVQAEASPEGAEASAGGASASAGPDGASVQAACMDIHAGPGGASVDGHGVMGEVQYDSLALEIVPDTSALSGLHQAMVLVFKVEGGVATQIGTSIATQVEARVTDVQGRVETTVRDASAAAFSLPLDNLELQPGDQLAFVVAAQAEAETSIRGAVDKAVSGAVSAETRLEASAVDYGIAFRLVDAAKSDIDAAVQQLRQLGGMTAEATVEAGAGAKAGAEATVQAGVSLLDRVAATGKAHVMATVGQAQGFDVGFFGELTTGLGAEARNLQFLTDSLKVSYAQESAARAVAATENIQLTYQGVSAEGWGFGLGAYGGRENGQVDYELNVDMHDQSFSTAGSITAAGPVDLGDADPAYVLSGAGETAQSMVFELARTAQEEAVELFTLHVDLSADLQAVLGVDSVVPATPESLVEGIPLVAAPNELTMSAGSLGTVRLAVSA